VTDLFNFTHFNPRAQRLAILKQLPQGTSQYKASWKDYESLVQDLHICIKVSLAFNMSVFNINFNS
jgi:hypothetical protein